MKHGEKCSKSCTVLVSSLWNEETPQLHLCKNIYLYESTCRSLTPVPRAHFFSDNENQDVPSIPSKSWSKRTKSKNWSREIKIVWLNLWEVNEHNWCPKLWKELCEKVNVLLLMNLQVHWSFLISSVPVITNLLNSMGLQKMPLDIIWPRITVQEDNLV